MQFLGPPARWRTQKLQKVSPFPFLACTRVSAQVEGGQGGWAVFVSNNFSKCYPILNHPENGVGYRFRMED